MPISVPFGWLPENQSYEGQTFAIYPVADLEEKITWVRRSGRVSRRWFYPPLVEEHREVLATGPPPTIHERVFELPATHQLAVEGHPQEATEIAPFLIIVFGFLKGLKLLPEGWLHFYRVAVEPGTLSDFELPGPALVEDLLGYALELRRRCVDVHREKGLFGAWHWHLFGQSYEHPFECFSAQYTVLESLWRIHCDLAAVNPEPPHARRPVELANYYGLDVPVWARLDGKNESPLSRLRNAFVHEGLFGSEPISFGHPRDYIAIDYELTVFNSRLFFSLMGVRGRYTSSVVNTGSRYPLF
jgi:hypothetical protein